jgi:peptide chain release factor 1
LDVRGRNAFRVFRCEGGTHSFGRVPPTERRGRLHTSTITVAVFQHSEKTQVQVRPKDLRFAYFRSNGPGGQHKNKTDSAVRLTHTPTGTVTIAQYGRSQSHNKQVALDALRAKLHRAQADRNKASRNEKRKSQVGRGARGEKVRTYCERKDLVVDHRSGKRTTLKKFLKGYIKNLR